MSTVTTVTLDERDLCDLECLSNGAFAPLTSYMTRAQYESCLSTMTLDSHYYHQGPSVFPIPIVLRHDEVPLGTVLTLKSVTGVVFASLVVKECWRPDLQNECVQVFGTDDDNHPYIKYLKTSKKAYCLSGDLTMKSTQFHDTFLEYRLSPEACRLKMDSCMDLVGFQTRNPLHRSHIELIRRSSNEDTPVLLHPVEGVTQECDIPFPVRMKCYQVLLPYLPNATLSILPLSMRMAGPREAVWHAVIRRNYGCTHFIVGRDHAGPSYKKKDGTSFYDPLAAQRLAKSMETQIGIKILASEEVVYCLAKDGNENDGQYMPVSKSTGHLVKQISGTNFRSMLEKGQEVPSWYTYPEVIKPLRDFYQRSKGLCVYFVGLSGSGKSTVAQRLRAKFQEEQPHREVTVLDADEIRTHLSKGLGFSRADRSTNVRRIGYVASEIVRHGGIVLVANIAPYEEDRQFNRRLIGAHGTYLEVYVNTPIEECEQRDVKGLYQAARAGTLANFTGVSDPFEVPESDLVLSVGPIEEQVARVWSRVQARD